MLRILCTIRDIVQWLGYGLSVPGFESRRGNFFFQDVLSWSGTHPASYSVGTGFYSRAYNVKNEWSYTSLQSLYLHGMEKKHFYGFYFTYFGYIQECPDIRLKNMIFCLPSYEGPVISQSPWFPASCKMFCPLEYQLHQIVNVVSQGDMMTFLIYLSLT